MKIDYKLEEVKPNIFAVVVKDNYDRAMLFCRVQEFYESPNPDFRGKDFNIWDYIEWYSREHNNSFTYPSDWSGFNIPLKVAWECYEGKDKPKKRDKYNGVRSLPDDWKSKWDETMKDIIWSVESRMFYKKSKRNMNAYIIGTNNIISWVFKHEVCHGLWSTNKEYNKTARQLLDLIDKHDFIIFRKNLLDMGYTDAVVDDEIHAYLMYGWDSDDFGDGVLLDTRKSYNNMFSEKLEKFIK